MLEKGSLLQFGERLLQLLLSVHHDRPIPRDRLFQRFSGDEQEPYAVVPGLHRDLVAAVEQDERAIVRLHRRCRISPLDGFSRDREWAGCVAEFSAAAKNVGEGMARGFHWK